MALLLDHYPDPRDPSSPLASAYAWLSHLAINLRAGTGRIDFDVHPHESAWVGQPVGRVTVALGQGVGQAHFPTLPELMADPEFAAAYAVIGTKLYTHAMAAVPEFAGATPA